MNAAQLALFGYPVMTPVAVSATFQELLQESKRQPETSLLTAIGIPAAAIHWNEGDVINLNLTGNYESGYDEAAGRGKWQTS